MPYHMGKTMVEQASEPGGNPAYLLKSAVPQRPSLVAGASESSNGGRPLGPWTYDIPSLPLIKEITRENASFASKTIKAKEPPPLTLDIDFQDPGRVAALIDVQRQVPPGFYGLTWGKQPQRPMDKFDQKLDKFYDCDTRLTQLKLGTVMEHTARKYAASFNSADRRFKPKKEIHSLAPGSYDPPAGSVSIKDGKRPTYQFKSNTNNSSFGLTPPNEPPDMIHSAEMAMQAAKWTSKGFPFSTSERFKRVRPKWKD